MRSSLGAEASSLSSAQERLDFVRILYAEIAGDLDGTLDGYLQYLQVSRALSVTGCKSLSDALMSTGSAVSHTADDPRLAIEIAMIKQRLPKRETLFQWVDAGIMVADVLTKGLSRGDIAILRTLLSNGVYCVRGTEEILEKNALERERRVAFKDASAASAASAK